MKYAAYVHGRALWVMTCVYDECHSDYRDVKEMYMRKTDEAVQYAYHGDTHKSKVLDALKALIARRYFEAWKLYGVDK